MKRTGRIAAAVLLLATPPVGEAGPIRVVNASVHVAPAHSAAGLSIAGLSGPDLSAPYLSVPYHEPAVRSQVDYNWKVRPLDGDPIALDVYRGKVLFINAWASWCTPCIREMAEIELLAARVGETDIVFLLVAVEGENSVRRHLRRYPIGLPIFLEEERFPAGFGLKGIPMTWVVDRDGNIVLRHFGAAHWDSPTIENFLRELL